MACTIIERVLIHFGYNDEAMTVVRGLLSDSMFPVVEILKDIFIIAGYQPSGKYATAEDNSLRGLILIVYALNHVFGLRNPKTGEFLPSLDNIVTMCTYGDDILGTVSDVISEAFNVKEYQKLCEKLYGMKFTSTDKSDQVSEFVDRKNMSFLKRNFVFSKEFQRWMAPLHKDSIMKSLLWVLPSKSVSSEKQLVDTTCSALWELFFHTDADKFERVRDRLISSVHSVTDMKTEELDAYFPDRTTIMESVGFSPSSL
jgi:hypothetical protein